MDRETSSGKMTIGPKILAIYATVWGLLTVSCVSAAKGQSLLAPLLSPLLAQAAAPAAETAAPAEVGGFWAIVFSGGWVGVLIVLTILMLSLMAAYLIIEQLMILRKAEIMPSGLADEVRQLLAQGRLAANRHEKRRFADCVAGYVAA